MTTIITEMLPSKMEITSKGKHPAIQTPKPCSIGDGAMLKMDDASDISVSSTLFGQSPSVYSKTEGKRVILVSRTSQAYQYNFGTTSRSCLYCFPT
jgi:hypothetical protein